MRPKKRKIVDLSPMNVKIEICRLEVLKTVTQMQHYLVYCLDYRNICN